MVEQQLPSTVHNHFHDVRLFKEQELGHGSFATVYRAQCDDLPCAAKVLHADFFDQQDPDPGEQTFISRFVEECKILPSITHPNIVQCFGTYQDPDTNLPVLLMELMDESLTDYIERFSGPLPHHTEISFSYDVALGLSYLHSRGYIHRDLSSNNVLIMVGIRAKITDFGMCRATTGVSKQTRLTLCPGTHPFMPPEALLEPPKYTDRLDVFTLGVVMIQTMSRQYPKPGPAHRQFPSSMLVQVVPEEERRSNHIRLIRYDHPMLPLAKRCIQNSQEMRPSSRDVCSNLRLLKESHDYQQSKDEASVEHKLERESQLHQLQLTKIMMETQGEIANMKAEHSHEIEGIHRYYGQQLQLQLTKTTMDMQGKIKTMKAEHSQQIESFHRQHERELQLQITKTTTDMQGKIETMKAEHRRQIENLEQLLPLAHLSQAPAIPPRGVAPQRQQSAQLKPPSMHGQPLSLEHRRDNQNLLPNGRRTAVPDMQVSGQSHHWYKPPPSPLLQQNFPPAQQPNMPIVPLNSKEKSNLIDKSQGKGIDSAKYNVVPDASSTVAKGASNPFDPSDLPDPVFDTHDLEMFHQEACSTEDPYASSNMSLLINPRSDDFGDYSGPNLDDHLTYRSHDFSHMGLSESPAGSAIGKTAEEKNESEQQLLEKETEQEDTCRSGSHLVLLEEKSKQEDTCISGSCLVRISGDVPRIKEANYSDVIPKDKEKSSSSALFQVGDYTSIDSQPPSIYSQSTHQTAPPVLQPRSFSGSEEKLSRHPSEGSLPTVTLSGAECPRPPILWPRSDNNLLSMKGLGTPPSSPSRNKPAIAPQMARSRKNESGTALGNIQTANRNISAEDESAFDATYVSQPLPLIHESLTIDDRWIHYDYFTSMESNSSGNLHSDAHTSLDSGSPHPSLESKPSLSKPDPCPSTPPEIAQSAYSGEKRLLKDVESSLSQDWIKVDLTVDKKDGKDGLSSLETRPRSRDRATAFSAFSTKPNKTVSDKSQKPKPPREEAYYDPPIHTDIQSATPCWYCCNLTTLEICDVCGNKQPRKATI